MVSCPDLPPLESRAGLEEADTEANVSVVATDAGPVKMTRLELRLTQGFSLVLGCALVIGGLLLWKSTEPPSIQRVMTHEVTTARTPAASRRRATSTRTDITRTTTTTAGSSRPGQRAVSPGHQDERSASLTITMIGGGILFLLVGLLLPRLRGASGAGASVTLDPIALVSRRARQRRSADSRLPRDLVERATALLEAQLSGEGAARESSAAGRLSESASPSLSSLIDQTLSAFVSPPVIRTGAERYAGDFVALSQVGPGGSLLGRILFYTDESHFDVVAAGARVSWGSEGAKVDTARRVLIHATGNQPTPEPVARAFLAGNDNVFVAGVPWTLPLEDVLAWIRSHQDESGRWLIA